MKIICSTCEEENKENLKYCSFCGYELPVLENEILNTEVKPSKVEKSKIRRILELSLYGTVAYVSMFLSTQYFFKPSIDKQLLEAAEEVNKVCPFTIDKYTIVNNVLALPNKTVQYNYTLVGIKKSEVQLDTMKKYVFPGILQNVKTNPKMKLYRDNKVTLRYYYSDENGEFVTEYIVKPEMYE